MYFLDADTSQRERRSDSGMSKFQVVIDVSALLGDFSPESDLCIDSIMPNIPGIEWI